MQIARFVVAATGSVFACACQKSIAMDPPCPPNVLCEDRVEVWPIVGPIVGLAGAVGLTIALVLGSRTDQPAFVPHGRSLSFAAVLAGVAAVLFAAAPVGEPDTVILGWPAMGCTFAAFLLGGTSLRPRGSRSRGFALGLITYLLAGLASVLVMNRGYIGDMDVLAWALQVLAWPGLLLLHLGGLVG